MAKVLISNGSMLNTGSHMHSHQSFGVRLRADPVTQDQSITDYLCQQVIDQAGATVQVSRDEENQYQQVFIQWPYSVVVAVDATSSSAFNPFGPSDP